MLKRDVREMVNYLVGERKSFKVTFANGKVEVVEYRGYCWVLGNKGYTDKELVEKMVRFQDNVSKFIIKLEVIEEVEEESLIEEVENLTDDLFQEEDSVYCEEAIKRESNMSCETNNIKEEKFMNENEKRILVTVEESVNFCLQRGIDKKQIAEWLDDVICDLSENRSSELFNTLYRIQDNLLFGNEF